MFGYVFPNELEVNWGLFIVLYPYITGLVAGAFVVSSLYHVFNISPLKPVSRLSLITALSFLFVAPLPLLSHLGQPTRAFNMLWTPNPTSAMAGFGYIYSFYLIIVLLEVWFMYRKDIVIFSETKTGFAKYLYNILSLGAKDISPKALETDHKIINFLAIVGIPSAAFLHGYAGFIFGSIKANAWWSTPLMPVIFFLSAIVSGLALLIVVYALSCRLRRQGIDLLCLKTLNKYLWAFLIFASTLEILEVVHKGYEGKEEWEMIRGLLTEMIPGSYFGIQLFMGVLIPLILLFIGRSKGVSINLQKLLTIISGVLVLIGVFAMRFNVVIGGQMISKSMAGYAKFHVSFFGEEGVFWVLLLASIPIVILSIMIRVLPPWIRDD